MVDKIIYEPLNRLEITLAEIMRTNYPGPGQESHYWLDTVEDLAEMLGTNKPRFDSNLFFERCFGEDWETKL